MPINERLAKKITMTFFSIIIPVYKGTFLKEAIISCLQQSYSNFELIIVNDASPEDIDSRVLGFDDHRIRYFKNETNLGKNNLIEQWNYCLSKVEGQYVICMGDDDKLMPNCLQEYDNLIRKYPKLNIYHAWTEIIDEHSAVYDMQGQRPEWESAYSLIWHRWNERKHQFIGDFLFKVDKLREKGGFYDLPLAWASDEISAIIAAEEGGIANTQVPCFQYRSSRVSITSSGKTNRKMEAVLREEGWYESFLSKKAQDPVDIIYKDLLRRECKRRFRKKRRSLIALDMSDNTLLRVFYWLIKCNKIKLNAKDILFAIVLAINNRISKR